MTNTACRVKAIVASHLQMDPAVIEIDDSFDRLGIDLFDLSTIVSRIEKEFGVIISEEQEDALVTLRDIKQLVEKLLQDKDVATG